MRKLYFKNQGTSVLWSLNNIKIGLYQNRPFSKDLLLSNIASKVV